MEVKVEIERNIVSYKGVLIYQSVGEWIGYTTIYIDELIAAGDTVYFSEVHYHECETIIKLLNGKFQVVGEEEDSHLGLNEAKIFIDNCIFPKK